MKCMLRNPNRPEVKLSQTIYWLDRVHQFAVSGDGVLPILMAGDFNSTPSSEVYKYLTDHTRHFLSAHQAALTLTSPAIHQQAMKCLYGHQTKFLCDSTLGRLCRWMRILGIDTKIDRHCEKHQKACTTKDYPKFFLQARRENRVILSTSRTLLERAECPRSSYINTKDLEASLIELCREYHLQLHKDKLLSVCGKCGADIETCDQSDERLKEHEYVPADRPVFICVECSHVS